jgi:hypothetical protein
VLLIGTYIPALSNLHAAWLYICLCYKSVSSLETGYSLIHSVPRKVLDTFDLCIQ